MTADGVFSAAYTTAENSGVELTGAGADGAAYELSGSGMTDTVEGAGIPEELPVLPEDAPSQRAGPGIV